MLVRTTRCALVGLIFALVAVARADEIVSYEGYKQARVQAATHADLDAIEAAGGIILNCIPAPGGVDVIANDAQLAAIRAAGMTATITNANVQAMIDAERAPHPITQDAYSDFFISYHRYGDAATSGTMVWYLNQLVVRYPGLATMINLGNSLQNRPIYGIRIANDAVPGPKPGVYYFGCQHAREWISTMICPYHARYLLENYATNATVRNMVDHTEIFLVPVANPDGYEYTWTNNRYWRKNRRQNSGGTFGVDLNRNWGYNWGFNNTGSSPSSGSDTYRGTAEFSEPETQRYRDFFLAHPNIQATLDIHSYSQLILWPWGHTTALPADQPTYQAVGSDMQLLILNVHGLFYDAGPIISTIYETNGDSADWAYGIRNVLAYSYELRGGGSQGFDLPASQIIPQNEELLPAMLRLTDWALTRPPIFLELPFGAPAELTRGASTPVAVNVRNNFDTVVAGSPTMYYRYDASGPFIAAPLTPVGGSSYQGDLPATHCGSTPQYYFTALTAAGTLIKNPPAGEAAPYLAGLTPRCGAGFMYGDHNGDDHVNLADYQPFADCQLGPAGGLAPDCYVFDFDDNDEVDLYDFAAMQRTMGQ